MTRTNHPINKMELLVIRIRIAQTEKRNIAISNYVRHYINHIPPSPRRYIFQPLRITFFYATNYQVFIYRKIHLTGLHLTILADVFAGESLKRGRRKRGELERKRKQKEK